MIIKIYFFVLSFYCYVILFNRSYLFWNKKEILVLFYYNEDIFFWFWNNKVILFCFRIMKTFCYNKDILFCFDRCSILCRTRCVWGLSRCIRRRGRMVLLGDGSLSYISGSLRKLFIIRGSNSVLVRRIVLESLL